MSQSSLHLEQGSGLRTSRQSRTLDRHAASHACSSKGKSRCVAVQAAEDASRARTATLPPLQSVVELTSAAQMPLRGELTADAQPSAAGARLPYRIPAPCLAPASVSFEAAAPDSVVKMSTCANINTQA